MISARRGKLVPKLNTLHPVVQFQRTPGALAGATVIAFDLALDEHMFQPTPAALAGGNLHFRI